MKRGIFCLSFDVEGTWGRRHLSNASDFAPYVREEKNITERILGELSRYDIQATWAVVGKLFEEDPGLMRVLQKARQEIAAHSYTHENLSTCSRAVAEREICSCVQAAEKEGIRPMSFVFPFNAVGYLDLLKQYGFTAYRGSSHTFNDFLLPRSRSVCTSHGLCNIRGSMYFPSIRKWGKYIPSGIRFMQAKKGMDHAVKSGGIFHLWTHPIDVLDASGGMWTEFISILRYANDLGHRGVLDIQTMDSIAGTSHR